jgi:ornithine carbamoyltransferase
MADLLTIYEGFGRLRGLKLAYVGDGNNVATSLLFGASKLGMDFAIASPPGYHLPSEVSRLGREFALQTGSQVVETEDPDEAVRDAHIIYTDVWTSMGQEAETEKRLRIFPPYQVNAALVARARPDVRVMHCLPAHRGQEITDEVADGPHSVLWDQAENRMHAQKAILAQLLVYEVV